MAITGFIGEMLAEGIIFRWLVRIWDTLKVGVGHEVVKEWAKTNLQPKGLDDESIFAYVLSEAEMGEKKKMLIQVLAKMKKMDDQNKTRHVRNFRLIIAMNAIGLGLVEIEKKDKDGKVLEVKRTSDPDQHPGLSILELLAKECNTAPEMYQFIIACGAMQKAPFGTLDEMKVWAEETAWPLISGWISSQWMNFNSWVQNTCQKGEDFYQNLEAEMDAFDNQSLWRKIIDPRNWFKQF